MRRPADLPPIARSSSFSTRTAQLAGVTRSRLRRTDLTSPYHGVRRTTDAPMTLDERCRAYQRVMPDGMFFSHATAAALYGLPLPRSDHELLHVGARRPRRAPRAAGIVGHRVTLGEGSVFTLRGLPVPAPVEVLLELAGMLGHDDLVRVGDALVRRTDPLSSMEELRSAVAGAHGRPGIPTLRNALEWMRARTDSPMETTLRLAIVRSGLPEPSINHVIDIGSGRTAHLDLAYPNHLVAIEYDGDHHRTDDRQYHLDGDRLWRIEKRGWRIVRINRSHMGHSAEEAVRRVRDALTSMGRNTPL